MDPMPVGAYSMRILDATCGARMMWHDRRHPNTVYVDRRIIPVGHPYRGRNRKDWEIRPDICASFTALPFRDNSFDIVLWDPPHILQDSTRGIFPTMYGTLPTRGWEDVLRQGFDECYRVTRGAVHFKWNDCRKPLKTILALFPIKPLYRTKGSTTWSIFIK